jgi:cytochrome c oxidase cbb3-type subunit III
MIRAVLAIILAALLLAACEREERSFRSEPPVEETQEKIALTDLSPGDAPAVRQTSGTGKDYESNAAHVSNGKTLFQQFNCSGCHGNGGGGSGPALMDDAWIYGSDIENIVATIREGRPNGMPSFRGKIADEQIWELAAYVRALGGFLPTDVATSRSDTMQAHESENRLPSPSGPAQTNPAPPASTQP